MSALYPENWQGFLPVFFVFLRFAGLFILVPGFSHSAIPARMKLLFSLVTALGLHHVVQDKMGPLEVDVVPLFVLSIREVAVGLVMGLAAFITFEALSLGAHFVGTQMGFGVASVMDPNTEMETSVIVVLKSWIVLMVFFALDIHHQVIALFVQSYELTKLFESLPSSQWGVVTAFIQISGKIFYMALKVSAPFMLLLFGMNAAVGILAWTLPQFNVILFSFPISITVGIAALYIIAPEYLAFIESALSEMASDMVRLLRAT